jgi:Fe-S-cluster-containing hydrogenase component 2
MILIELHEQACRGCEMCVDICPTDVLVFDSTTHKASVAEAEDCIGCLSCAYLCPSRAIQHGGHHVVRNFYRDVDFCARMEKFL